MTEAQARKKAEALAKRLGPQWISQVWENLGWHYSVSCLDGRFTIHPCSFQQNNQTTFTSFMHPTDTHCGHMEITENFSHRDPKKVVQHQIGLLLDYVESWNDFVKEIKKAKIISNKGEPK